MQVSCGRLYLGADDSEATSHGFDDGHAEGLGEARVQVSML